MGTEKVKQPVDSQLDEDLLQLNHLINSKYTAEPQGRIGMVKDLMKKGKRLIDYVRKVKPDVLVGTSVDISYTGKLLGIPAINVNEDDADVVPMYAWLAYPFATSIVSPESCNNRR